MYKMEEEELTNRINTFMAAKLQKYPELEKVRPRTTKNAPSRYELEKPTFLEKMNEFWVQRVHA